MGFYDTIAVSFLIILIALFCVDRFGPTVDLRRRLMVLLGLGVIALSIYYVVQLILDLPPITQAFDLPAIMLGALAAIGLVSAWGALKARYMPDR